MSRNFTFRKRMFFGFVLAIIFNFISLFIWSTFYIEPNIEKISQEEISLKNTILNNNYENYDDLLFNLNNITNIKYTIQNLDNEYLNKTQIKK